ncbi:macrophage mannose receptor 1 [Anoplophora glabripennis]|uniref:Brevican core protein n=1 Tax=Anoplophora glabripennis TaxID=217634 RepID=V5I9P4_ANOGL|nr:macrophage mannose receptor 1 [Anoplophora glabripennis]
MRWVTLILFFSIYLWDYRATCNLLGLFGYHPTNPTFSITIINNVKYWVSNYKATQEQASEYCKMYGMKLVSILDQEKSNDVTYLIRRDPHNIFEKYFWTSGKRQANNVWTWGDNQPMIYTNWIPLHEGINLFWSPRCMYLKFNGKWKNIWTCNTRLFFICEQPYIESFESKPVTTVNVDVSNHQMTPVTYTTSTDPSLSIEPRFDNIQAI